MPYSTMFALFLAISSAFPAQAAPVAAVPFGMVKAGPVIADSVIYGFTHAQGDILIMPTTGASTYDNGGGDPDKGYPSRFDKASERAEPGYYAVELSDYGIGVELTASERVGLHRYRLPEGEEAYVIVDLDHGDPLKAVELRIVSSHILAGFRRSSREGEDRVEIYSIHFSRPIARQPKERTLSKMVVPFGAAGGELLVKVGLSTVDLNGVQRNMAEEMPESAEGWDFDAYRAAARASWDEYLDKVEPADASEEQKARFRAALYRALIAARLDFDVDGRYLDAERKVRHRDEKPLAAQSSAMQSVATLVDGGKNWTIRREGTGAHVRSVKLDGKALERVRLSQEELAAGGEWVFVLGE